MAQDIVRVAMVKDNVYQHGLTVVITIHINALYAWVLEDVNNVMEQEDIMKSKYIR